MFEAEIVSPLAADLHKALHDHELLVGVSDDKIEVNSKVTATPEEIQASLETIRHLQFQLETWEDCLTTHEQLHRTYYTSTLELAESHHTFGILHKRLQQYDLSQKHLEQSLAYYQQLHPNRFHVQVGEAWNELAALFGAQMELGDAQQYLHLAEPHYRYSGHEMYADLPEGEEGQKPHPELRKILENQGKILRYMNEHENALTLYREIEQLHGLDTNLRLDLADCLLTLGDRQEAKKLYEQVIRTLDPDSLVASNVHHQLGLVHATMPNEEAEALKQFQLAYTLRKRLLGDMNSLVGQTVNAMGAVQAALDQPGAALSSFREALVIARMNSGFKVSEEDPEVKHIMKNIALVQRGMEQATFARPGED
jgi:tetratricopeptide (TPR) repeat protein